MDNGIRSLGYDDNKHSHLNVVNNIKSDEEKLEELENKFNKILDISRFKQKASSTKIFTDLNYSSVDDEK